MRKREEQKRCEHCGRKHNSDLRACPACGRENETWYSDVALRCGFRVRSQVSLPGKRKVFLADGEGEQRDVVIEFLRKRKKGPEADEAFADACERTAHVFDRLIHRSFARLHGLERHGEVRFLVWEHVEGQTLEQKLDQGEPLPADEVRRMGRQLASALDEAASAGLAIFGLTKSDIVIDANGVTRIALVDIPRQIEHARSRDVAHGRAPSRPDVAALATILYEALAGHAPYFSHDHVEEVRFVNPFPIQDASAHVNQALTLAIKDPSRYRGTQHLMEVYGGAPIPIPPGQRTAGSGRRLKVLAAVMFVLAALLVIVQLGQVTRARRAAADLSATSQSGAPAAPGPPPEPAPEEPDREGEGPEPDEVAPEAPPAEDAAGDEPVAPAAEGEEEAGEGNASGAPAPAEAGEGDAPEEKPAEAPEPPGQEHPAARPDSAAEIAARTEAALVLLDAARQRKDANDRRGALTLLTKALTLDPDNEEIINLLHAVKAMLPQGFIAVKGARIDPETGLPIEIRDLKDGSAMVLVLPGRFTMGVDNGPPDAGPARLVHVDPFYISRHEVSVAQFEKFAQETGYRTVAERNGFSRVWKLVGPRYVMRSSRGASWRFPRGGTSARLRAKLSHAVVHVTASDAQAYARWAGLSLPTEAQWEKAARGADARQYPWGNTPPVDESGEYRANYAPLGGMDADGARFTAPVSMYPQGESPFGALNMAGNVRELCLDVYAEDAYRTASDRNPIGPERGAGRIVRGGSWQDSVTPRDDPLAAWTRSSVEEAQPDCATGFRCVLVP